MPIKNEKYVITETARNADIRRSELRLAISNAIERAQQLETGLYGHLSDNDILCVLTAMAAELARKNSE